MKDAEALMRRFFIKYPISHPCPYSLPTEVLHPEKRCFGYLLERYINVWAVSKNVSFVYAVDHPEWRNQGNWKLKKVYDISQPVLRLILCCCRFLEFFFFFFGPFFVFLFYY
jgi:hypothetical protein